MSGKRRDASKWGTGGEGRGRRGGSRIVIARRLLCAANGRFTATVAAADIHGWTDDVEPLPLCRERAVSHIWVHTRPR